MAWNKNNVYEKVVGMENMSYHKYRLDKQMIVGRIFENLKGRNGIGMN